MIDDETTDHEMVEEKQWLRRVTKSGGGASAGNAPSRWRTVWQALDEGPAPAPMPKGLASDVMDRLRLEAAEVVMSGRFRLGAAACFLVGLGLGLVGLPAGDPSMSGSPTAQELTVVELAFEPFEVTEPTLAEAYWTVIEQQDEPAPTQEVTQ